MLTLSVGEGALSFVCAIPSLLSHCIACDECFYGDQCMNGYTGCQCRDAS